MGTRAAAVLGCEAWWEGILVNREDVIRMAKEAGWATYGDDLYPPLERFAAIVAAAEREKVAAWMRSKSYATGHGDTIEDLLKELEWQVAEREREACAKVCEEKKSKYEERASKPEDERDIDPEVARIAKMTCDFNAAAIRARGEA